MSQEGSTEVQTVPAQLQDLLSLVSEDRYIRALLLLALGLVIAKVADLVITRVIRVWVGRTRTDVDDEMIRLSHRPVFVSVLLVALWLATVELQLPDPYHLFTLRLLKTVALVVWFAFAIRSSAVILDAISRHKDRLPGVSHETLPLFSNVARIILVGAAAYFLFLSWDIDVGALVATMGIAGIAVGFAAKDTLSNLFSGIFILADRPYKIGDFVVLDTGERGRVTDIGLRSTRLLTRDDIEVTIPNAVIGNAKIVNESGGPWEKERIRVQVGVAYGSDVDRVRETLLEVAGSHPDVTGQPAPRVRFRAFGDSSLDFELLCWIDEPVLRGRVLDSLLTQIYKRFQADGIEIPFPQRDVHLHQD